MKYPSRTHFADAGKSLMWDRWQKGESLHSSADHFGRSHTAIWNIFARTRGTRPAPAVMALFQSLAVSS
jgi:IS30 family transposase